jgi:hypothetical protein
MHLPPDRVVVVVMTTTTRTTMMLLLMMISQSKGQKDCVYLQNIRWQ